jgi:cell division inhibitor SepF
MMSALHRLKAYFGMVPAEEFNPSDFESYHSDYRFGHPEPGYNSQGHGSQGYGSTFDSDFDRADCARAAANSPRDRDHAIDRFATHRPHRATCDDYEDSSATQAGHSVTPRVHVTRPPSWATDSPVHGSLAIDTASLDEAASLDARPTVRQPVAPQRVMPAPRTGTLTDDPFGENGAHPLARIVTLHPHSYNEARPIGERYREGNPVIMNLTEMEDRDAKRLVDFAAGLAFALRGSIDKVTNKVFLLSPPNVSVAAEDKQRIAEGGFFNQS